MAKVKTSNGFVPKKRPTQRGKCCEGCYYHSDDPKVMGIHQRGCTAPNPLHKPCSMGRDGNWVHEFTPTFRKGDKVQMFGCGEVQMNPEWATKIWTCTTDSEMFGTSEVVFLDGFRGSFSCEFLKLKERG